MNTKLIKQIPSLTNKIYDDTLSEPAKILSNAVSDILKFVALPFTFLGMTSEELKNKYELFLMDSVSKIPSDKIINPEPLIITRLFEDVKFVFNDKVLLEMFSHLLTSSMNKDTYRNIHISFVNIISQLDTMDAKLFKEIHTRQFFPICDVYFTNQHVNEKIFSRLCSFDGMSGTKLSMSIVNLIRLGLIEILEVDNSPDKNYDEIKEIEEYKRLEMVYKEIKCNKPEYSDYRIDIVKQKVSFTMLGELFSDYVF